MRSRNLRRSSNGISPDRRTPSRSGTGKEFSGSRRGLADRLGRRACRSCGCMRCGSPFGYFGTRADWAWRSFDPFPFGLLTTIVSLEAIFLSTFVLVSQEFGKGAGGPSIRTGPTNQPAHRIPVNPANHSMDRIAKKMDVRECDDEELEQLKQDVEPQAVLRKIEKKSAAHQIPQSKKNSPARHGYRLATSVPTATRSWS